MNAPTAKWVDFREVDPKPKTRVFLVLQKDTSGVLGRVSWWGPWRRYAFFPEVGTLYESQCLHDIAAFCDWLMDEHRRRRPA